MDQNIDTQWKDAIVFISSTFNDMHAERDYLIKEVFPELTEWCEKFHIRLTDIDLRWGVTEEDASNSKTIETCLRHVDKSRPFFLCFLGQRRGWVPNFDRDISEETKKIYGIEDLKDRSATEMEIEHALLKPLEILLDVEKQPEACKYSIFFFRDDGYSKKLSKNLSPDQRLIYTNEYLKQMDISSVMAELKGTDNKLYESILNNLKDDFITANIKYPQFISELINDILKSDCKYYNNLIEELINNPINEKNIILIAELKFKNPGIFKEILNEIKDNDDKLYTKLLERLDNYQYEHVGIKEFCEIFNYPIINEIIQKLDKKNEEIFNIHESELDNIRKKIENKKKNNKELNILINDYKGQWEKDLILPELSHYKFNEGHGRLTNFECNGLPLKEVIINQFKRQFELEFKDHIEKIVNKNPELFEDEISDIVEINPSEKLSLSNKQLANELFQQENFCHINSEGFVPREKYTNKLKKYVESSDNTVSLVSAEPGLGKTMLLADFAINFNSYFPNKKLYKRFCGGSDLSSETYTLWKSIIDEVGINNKKDCYPNNILELRRNFNDILEEISKKEEVVILIDAVNQMENGLNMLKWFNQLPKNLKVIISVKEVNLNTLKDNEEKEEDKLYQEELESIKTKKSISQEHSFSINALDNEKENYINKYIKEINNYTKNNDKNIFLINSELNYDKSLVFHKYNYQYPNQNIYNIKCSISRSNCTLNKVKKSIREFDDKQTSIDIREISGKNEDIKKELINLFNSLPEDSILFIDVMNDNAHNDLFNELMSFNYKTKTIIGIKNFNKKSNVDLTINELDNEKNRIIKSYLSNYLKELDEKEIHDICNFNGSKNPLYLKILLSELRVFGSFDQLKDEIIKFGDKPLTAFMHVFERLEKDEIVRGDEIKVSKPLFSLLASSRVGGLSEDEIVTIIKDEYNLDHDKVTNAINLNLRQVKPFMARKEGRYDFFYEKFREAAKKYYEKEKNKNLILLTNYFKDKSDNTKLRRYMELPYYLNESGNIDELEKTLSSYTFIKNKLYLSEDIYNLIQDYNYLNIENTEDNPLKLIQRALELSAPILMNHPHELPVQLYGRMKDIDDNIINNLLEDLVNDTKSKWLKPTTNSLYSPKSSIIKRFQPEGNATSSLEVTADKKIIIGTNDGILNIYNLNENDLEFKYERSSHVEIIKIILLDNDTQMLVAYRDGLINKFDIKNKEIIKHWDISKYKAEITDIYYSETYRKIYASSHSGLFTINLENDYIRKEDVENKNYNQIIVPRRNESILVCDEKEVDGWDVYEMRKAYNQHQQHKRTEEDMSEEEIKGGGLARSLNASGDIKFMGLVKRFLILISENGQMKMWNSLNYSGTGESIDELFITSPQDKFAQAITLENKEQIITMSNMGVLKVYNIPVPDYPNFRLETYENSNNMKEIQTGIFNPTAITYYSQNEDEWIIIGNKSNEINIIDLNKQVKETKHKKHDESVLTIKLNDEIIITASNNGELLKWDINTNKPLPKKNDDQDEFRYDCVSYDNIEEKLVCCGTSLDKEGHIRKHQSIWHKDKRISFEKPDKQIIDVTQNKNGIIFVDSENLNINKEVIKLKDKKITLNINGKNVEVKKEATTLSTIYNTGEVFIGFNDGSLAKYTNDIAYYETKNKTRVEKIKTTKDKIIVGYENGKLELYTHNLDEKPKIINAHENAIMNIHVINDNEIITVSKDRTLKIWDIRKNLCTYTYYLDIYATSINMKDDKIILGDSLGNVRFFKLIKEKEEKKENQNKYFKKETILTKQAKKKEFNKKYQEDKSNKEKKINNEKRKNTASDENLSFTQQLRRDMQIQENKNNIEDASINQQLGQKDVKKSSHENNIFKEDNEKNNSSDLIKKIEELNKTTKSIYDLDGNKVLIILEDGTNYTKYEDVQNTDDIIFINEDVSEEKTLRDKYKEFSNLKVLIIQNLTNKTTSMYQMCKNCKNLEILIPIKWDTSNINNMNSTFMNCEKLSMITHLKWNTSNVRSMIQMFSGCRNLKNIKDINSWIINKSCKTKNVFKDVSPDEIP